MVNTPSRDLTKVGPYNVCKGSGVLHVELDQLAEGEETKREQEKDHKQMNKAVQGNVSTRGLDTQQHDRQFQQKE